MILNGLYFLNSFILYFVYKFIKPSLLTCLLLLLHFYFNNVFILYSSIFSIIIIFQHCIFSFVII